MILMTRRYGRKHWFLFEMPWHADGVHTDDSPLDLIICNGPNERSWQARRLEYFGRMSMDAGSWEARRYMQNALVVLAPDVSDSVSFKSLTMDELIVLYKRHCLGNVPLFD